MDSVDKLLAHIKTTDQQPGHLSKSNPDCATDGLLPFDPGDTVLEDLDLKPDSDIDDLLQQVDAEATDTKGGEVRVPNHPPPVAAPGSTAPLDALLGQVKATYEMRDRVAEQEKQQQLQAEQQRQQQLREQRRLVLRQSAEAWLGQLDPWSPEGMWFNEFAEGYASRLDAAVDYLEALQETRPEMRVD